MQTAVQCMLLLRMRGMHARTPYNLCRHCLPSKLRARAYLIICISGAGPDATSCMEKALYSPCSAQHPAGCWCQECDKGSFKPGDVNWYEAVQVPGPGALRLFRLVQYNCRPQGHPVDGPCCLCNPDGYTTASTGGASGDACSNCLPGYGWHEQDVGVPSCVCLPCPTGTYSGKLVHSPSKLHQMLNTACDVALISTNNYLTMVLIALMALNLLLSMHV